MRMKKLLLALPLLLVVGLLFVELPVGNTSSSTTVTNSPTPTTQNNSSVEQTPTQTKSVTNLPSQNSKLKPTSNTKIDIGGKKTKHSNEDGNESGEDEGNEEDDD
jgi:hypothetical protein